MKKLYRILLVASFIIISTSTFSYSLSSTINTQSSVYWNDKFWYSERLPKSCEGSDCGRKHKIFSYDIYASEAPRLEFQIDLPDKYLWLVGDADKLWIVSDETTGYFNGEQYQRIDAEEPPYDFSRPFIYKGLLTTIEQPNRGSFVLKSLNGSSWVDAGSFNLSHDNKSERVDNFLEAVTIGDEIHFFLGNKGMLYYHEGIPVDEFENYKNWEGVTHYDGYWTSADIDGEPAVFYGVGSGFRGRKEGSVFSNNAWENTYKSPDSLFGYEDEISVSPISGGNFVAFQETMFRTYGSLVEGGKITSSFKIGKMSMICKIMLFEIIMILCIIAMIAIIISNPFWAYVYSITQYSETREYPIDRVNIPDILSRDYSKAKSYLIKARKERKALTIRPKFTKQLSQGSQMKAVQFSVFYFEEEMGIVKIKLVSKLPVFILPIFVILFFMCVITVSASYGANPIMNMLTYAMAATWVIGLPVTMYFQSRITKKRLKDFFDLILVYLGIEEKLEIETLI